MIMSMTGFATKIITIALDAEHQTTITLSIKSLNSRFFEATFKMPYAFSHLETELMQQCKTVLKRGYVFFTINMSNPNLSKVSLTPCLPVVQGYLDALNTVQKKFNIEGKITISDLMQLPNIFSIEETVIDEELKQRIFASTQEVLTALLETRKKEGLALQKDLEQRYLLLIKNIEEIEKLFQAAMKTRKERIGHDLHQLGVKTDEITEAHRALLYTELTKTDIHEEIIRFKTHLQTIKSLLQSPDIEKGKRLDFTVQELAREVNTIAAKCSDATVGALAINIKVELEKIREQAQNIV